MSAKWKRSQRWDDEHIPAWAWPIKAALRALSSISLAVVLLTLVALYGVLASVPIGLLALSLTWVVYIAVCAAMILAPAAAGAWVARRLTRPGGPGVRFATGFLAMVAAGAAGAVAWAVWAWPALRYDPAYGEGFRLFPEFVQTYDTVTVRRLPGVEMTELEFYSWWPLRIILMLFIINMVTATVRRIEFTFKNIGVLTVHTGIVVIAIGSIYYQALKKEGDTILFANPAPLLGQSSAGPPQVAFYDNTYVVLYSTQRPMWDGQFRWEQRPLPRLPRYNDYNLGAGVDDPEQSMWLASRQRLPWEGATERDLRLSTTGPTGADGEVSRAVDPDIRLSIVGYAQYAEPREDLVRSEPAPGVEPTPMRMVKLFDRRPGPDGAVPADDRPSFSFALRPTRAASRVSEQPGLLGVEYTMGMPEDRWALLSSPMPIGARHALAIEIDPIDSRPGYSAIVAVEAGQSVVAGDSGYTFVVSALHDTPPFPIITEGYENGVSSVAELALLTPPDETGERESVQRYVYHRFPEIDQELLPNAPNEAGMPARRDPDPRVRVRYIDLKHLQVYLDERPDGSIRAIVRQPGFAEPTTLADLEIAPDGVHTLRDAFPQIDFRVTHRWDHVEPFQRPDPVAEVDRDAQFVGSHQKSMVAVEVAVMGPDRRPSWSQIVWVPFSQYLIGDAGRSFERRVDLPDGRPPVRLAFGRRQHPLPGFQLRLVDFEMIAYDHRGAPRDYQSIVRVEPTAGNEMFESYEHAVTLNAPLTAPFLWDPDRRGFAANLFGRLTSGLDPNQYKLSQAGWDAEGWRRSQAQADAGQIPEPFAQFTILGVGNNPGIHVIAAGGVLMGIGIPWAFYVKPWLVRREKRRLAAEARSASAQKNAPASKDTGSEVLA